MSELMKAADALYAKIEPLANTLDAAWNAIQHNRTLEGVAAYEKARVNYNNAMTEFNRADALAKGK